jgi:hypothetical protein
MTATPVALRSSVKFKGVIARQTRVARFRFARGRPALKNIRAAGPNEG